MPNFYHFLPHFFQICIPIIIYLLWHIQADRCIVGSQNVLVHRWHTMNAAQRYKYWVGWKTEQRPWESIGLYNYTRALRQSLKGLEIIIYDLMRSKKWKNKKKNEKKNEKILNISNPCSLSTHDSIDFGYNFDN